MISNIELKKTAQYIFEKTGIIYQEESYFQLEKRIVSFCEANHLKTENFLPSLMNNSSLSLNFLELATNNESYFFRDPLVWETLLDLLIKKIKSEKLYSFNVLFIGCSRGQEIYSLFMLIAEKKREFANIKFTFSAYDFNSSVLAQAEKGIYTALEVSRGISPARLATYFTGNKENPPQYEFNKQYKLPCNFKTFNLRTDSLPQTAFDLIICRNVLIYQSDEAKKKSIQSFYQALNQGGVLLLGGAEKILSANIGSFNEQNINSITFYFK